MGMGDTPFGGFDVKDAEAASGIEPLCGALQAPA